MAEFNVSNDLSTLTALTTAFKTQLALLAQTATLRRGRIAEMTFGPYDNPLATDCNIVYAVFKQTTGDGTADTVTPTYTPAIEAGTEPTSAALCKANYTVEPSAAASEFRIFGIPMNQHSSFQWYAPEVNSMEWAAVNNKGFGFRAKGASSTITSGTATVLWRVKWAE
jgi:hypothetical protein